MFCVHGVVMFLYCLFLMNKTVYGKKVTFL